VATFSFNREINRVKKWSVDLIIELYKIGGSDFVGIKEGISFNILEFDENGFCMIDKCVFSLKNPERGAFQFVKSYFSNSRLVQLNFMYHAISFNYLIQTSFPIRTDDNANSKISPFMLALSELSNNCKKSF
jgi:hypothetical protein